MSLAQWGQLIFLGVIWGGSFFFARIAVAEIHPLALVLFRVAIAAAALHLFLLARGLSFRSVLPLAPSFFGIAVLNNVIPFSLIFAGQTELGAGLAAALNATTPFWTILIASVLTKDERLSVQKLIGIALGVAGTCVMVGPGLVAGLGGPVWAKFALIGASLSYAFAAIFARRFKGVPSALVATGQLTASTIIMVPVVLITLGPVGLFTASAAVWAAVIALALLSTAIGYIVFFGLIASAGATNTSLVTLIVPASAMLLGTLLLGETLALEEIAGAALIVVGLVVIDGRLTARLTSRSNIF
jgi:drug/metabolite transporter (DMT)-like permease